MEQVEITMIYAGLLTILFICLAFQTALARDESSSVGEGSGELLKKSRVVGNLAEHAPLMLIMMMMLEGEDWPKFFIHFLGILFLLCRLSHAYGILYQDGFGPKENPTRAGGAIGSWALMALAAIFCILTYLF